MSFPFRQQGDAVQFEEKGDQRHAQFEFLAQLTDTKGKQRHRARYRRSPAAHLGAEKIKSGQIMYSTGFQLNPGEYHLKFLVRATSHRQAGTFEQPISFLSLEGKNLQISSVAGQPAGQTREQFLRRASPGIRRAVPGARRNARSLNGRRQEARA